MLVLQTNLLRSNQLQLMVGKKHGFGGICNGFPSHMASCCCSVSPKSIHKTSCILSPANLGLSRSFLKSHRTQDWMRVRGLARELNKEEEYIESCKNIKGKQDCEEREKHSLDQSSKVSKQIRGMLVDLFPIETN